MADAPFMSQAKQVLNSAQQGIGATQQLRITVTNVFEFLKNGVSSDEGRSQFLHKFQDLLHAINKDFTELEKVGNSMTTMPDLPISPLGPAGQLSMESSADDNVLFESTLKDYQWYTKLHSRAQVMHSLKHTCKRVVLASATSVSRPKYGGTNMPRNIKYHSIPPQQVENFLQNTLLRLSPDLSVKLVYSQGSTRIMHLTVSKVFFVLILFRNLMFEKILVRGLDEDISSDGNCPDMSTPSRYECMRQISDNAISGLLYVEQFTHIQVELKSKFMLTWLQSYKTLFSDSCQKCGKILNDGVPPTWRDFKSHAAFHRACK